MGKRNSQNLRGKDEVFVEIDIGELWRICKNCYFDCLVSFSFNFSSLIAFILAIVSLHCSIVICGGE